MKRYFNFEFSLDDGDRIRNFGLALPVVDMTPEQEEALDEAMIDFCGEDAESFGVHDFYGGEADGIRSMGYASYEVQEADIDTLMQKWRDFFSDYFAPHAVGPVMELPAVETDMAETYRLLTQAVIPAPSAPKPPSM